MLDSRKAAGMVSYAAKLKSLPAVHRWRARSERGECSSTGYHTYHRHTSRVHS